MTTTIKSNGLHAQSCLFDVYFSLMARVYLREQNFSLSDASAEVVPAVTSIIEMARAQNVRPNSQVEAFYQKCLIEHNKGRVFTHIRPLIKILETEVEHNRLRDCFTTLVKPYSPTTPIFYKEIPKYFSKHSVDGFKAICVNSFSDDELQADAPAIIFSRQEFESNCFKIGYIKNSIEVRIIAPRYDTKLRDQIIELFNVFNLKATSASKVFLKNNMQVWSFKLDPLTTEKESIAASERMNIQIQKVTNEYSDGDKFFVYLEDEQNSKRGFSSLAATQKFIDRILIDAIGITSDCEGIILKNSLFMLSIHDSNGTAVNLRRFSISKTGLKAA
ncbi:hypothetical protein V6259_13115 [Marinomonas sp. TI.3.20]|uniref:hypothetical protein n=1 Tax=Marinomonas sp. TI.3.20 TaxID=3121296 RepID=UPI00311FC386